MLSTSTAFGNPLIWQLAALKNSSVMDLLKYLRDYDVKRNKKTNRKPYRKYWINFDRT
jgi:hypothetical protein